MRRLNYRHFDALSEFERSVVETHVWADTMAYDGEDLDTASMLVDGSRPSGDDETRLTIGTLRSLVADARDFEKANRADLDALAETHHLDESELGHCFALSRSGHGSGFFDYAGGDKLQQAAKFYGEVSLILEKDGRIRLF